MCFRSGSHKRSRLILAQRFRARAAECLALAEMTAAPELVARYREMAARYERLAAYEEDAAEKIVPNVHGDGHPEI